jgi:hypothetical protein
MRTNEMNQQKMSLRIFRIVELVLIPLDLIALNVIAGHGKIGKKIKNKCFSIITGASLLLIAIQVDKGYGYT